MCGQYTERDRPPPPVLAAGAVYGSAGPAGRTRAPTQGAYLAAMLDAEMSDKFAALPRSSEKSNLTAA